MAKRNRSLGLDADVVKLMDVSRGRRTGASKVTSRKDGRAAVIYVRVSSEDQVENWSLETQEDACRAYCTREGFAVAQVFREEGMSAKTVDRDEFLRAVDYCVKNKDTVGHFVVLNLSRFSRLVADHIDTNDLLQKHDITLHSATEPISDDSGGRLMQTIFSAFAQFDNDRRGEATVTGMQKALRNAQWVHRAPLGYINADDPCLVPDPERAPLVRHAFKRFATGTVTRNELLRELNAKGMRTRSWSRRENGVKVKFSGKPLAFKALDDLLRNPIYVGHIRHERWGIEAEGNFEPLVSQELFDRVQHILAGSGWTVENRKTDHPDFPLRRFTTCGRCGRMLTGSITTNGIGKEYPFYRCPDASCATKSIPAARLHSLFMKFVGEVQPTPEVLELFTTAVVKTWSDRRAEANRALKDLRNAAVDLERKKTRLAEARFVQGDLDPATYTSLSTKLDAELVAVRGDLATRSAQHRADVGTLTRMASEVLVDLGGAWKAFSPRLKLRLQNVIFPGGLATDGQRLWNTEKVSAFSPLRELKALCCLLVTDEGSDWNKTVNFLERLADLRRDAVADGWKPKKKAG